MLPGGGKRKGGKKKGGSKGSLKRSVREKKEVVIQDLGYVENKPLKGAKSGAVETHKRCERIIQLLKKHPCAEPFLKPVDPQAMNMPNYSDHVKSPIDLSTIEKNLKSGNYPSTYQFGLDVRQIWSNSWMYNARDSHIYIMTMEISSYFEKLFKDMENLPLIESKGEMYEMRKTLDKMSKEINELHKRGSNVPGGRRDQAQKMKEKPMSMEEKTKLSQNIKRLTPDKLRGIIDIISDTVDMNRNKEVLEFDIDTLPPKKCRELERYVNQNLPSANKKKKSTKTQQQTQKMGGISSQPMSGQMQQPPQPIQQQPQPPLGQDPPQPELRDQQQQHQQHAQMMGEMGMNIRGLNQSQGQQPPQMSGLGQMDPMRMARLNQMQQMSLGQMHPMVSQMNLPMAQQMQMHQQYPQNKVFTDNV